MPTLAEAEPLRGVPLPVIPGVRRVVAPNPGPMTYWGTNTYLLDGPDGTVVVDPGPDDPAHVAAVLDAAGGRVSAILLTHSHKDHLGALPALRAAAGAPVHAWGTPPVPGFAPDVPVADGDRAAGLLAIHTPGHASDHLCFARTDGVVFSGDHVMGWSSTVVSPPDGDMARYLASLRRLLARDGDLLYLPGHGPALPEPLRYAAQLLDHRLAREAAVLAALCHGPRTTEALTAQLYAAVDARLLPAAQRNVAAHLGKLVQDGRVVADDGGWRLA